MGAGGRPADVQGVYYPAEDYAGLWRRIAVELVDIVAIVVLLLLVTIIAALVTVVIGGRHAVLLVIIAWLASVYWYLVILKGSRFKTLGYRLARVRVVDFYGRPAGLASLSVRLLFSVIGPFNIVLDLIWIPSDPFKQSLRDKAAHTYVVTSRAQPRGPARIIYRNYYLLGMSFVFQELEPPKVRAA